MTTFSFLRPDWLKSGLLAPNLLSKFESFSNFDNILYLMVSANLPLPLLLLFLIPLHPI